MKDAVLPVAVTLLVLLWAYLDERASQARTARVYARNYSRGELRRLGRQPDGTLDEPRRNEAPR